MANEFEAKVQPFDKLRAIGVWFSKNSCKSAQMKKLLALSALLLATPAAAQEAGEPATPGSVIAGATAEEWLPIAPDDLLVMELAPDERGNLRTVVIQLIPPPFSQPWVENIRTLARAHWWEGTSVNRVQDN